MERPAQNDVSDIVTTANLTVSDVVLAIVSLIAAWLLARLTRHGVLRLLQRLEGIGEDVRQLGARVAFYFVILIGVGVAFTFLGASLQPFITAAIILAVVAGLALRGIADNFAAGVVIQTRRPIEIGDDVEVLDHSGTVQEINGRSVVLEAWDGREIHIPNSQILDNPLVNHSAQRTRRSEVEVRLAIRDDFDEAVAAVVDTVAAVPGVLGDPPPDVLYRTVDPERIVIVVRFAHAPTVASTVAAAVVRAIAVAERSRGRDVTVTTPAPAIPVTTPAKV